MADIIARFKGDTSDLDGKIGKASKGLMQMKADCEKVGGAFINLDKEQVDFIKSLGKLETGAKSAKGTMSELTKAFTDMSAVYNRLTEEEKRDEGGKALRASLDQLKERIKDGSKELNKISGEINNNGNLLDQLSGKFGVNIKQLVSWGGAIGAGKMALDVMKDAFLSNEQGVDDWGRTVEGAESLYRSFCASLNNMNLQGFFNNMDEIFNHAKKVYDAMDNLKTHGGIISNNEARLNAQRAQYQKILKDPNATDAQKAAARTGLKNVQNQKAAAVDETKALNNDYIKKYLKQKFVTEGGLTEVEYKKYYGDIVRSLYDTSAADALNNQWVSRTTKRHGVSSTSGLATSTTQNYRLNVGAMLKDSDREALNPYIQAYWNADARKYQDERADNRILGSGSSNTPKTPKTSTPKEEYIPIAGSADELREKIKALNEEWGKVGTQDERDSIMAQIEAATKALDVMQGKVEKVQDTMATGKSYDASNAGVAWLLGDIKTQLDNAELGSALYDNLTTQLADATTFKNIIEQWTKAGLDMADLNAPELWQKLFDGENIDDSVWQNLVDTINKKLAELGDKIEPIKIDFKTGSVEKLNKETERLDATAQGIANVFNNASGALGQFAESSEEAAQAQKMFTIAASIAQLTAQFAAIPKGADIWSWIAGTVAGVATLTSAIAAINSATGGGKYADGGIIPGNSYSGDNLTAHVNSGELILNTAQQGVIANELQQNSQHYESHQPYITSEMIYLGLNNYLMRRGKGEIVTTH